MKIIIPIMAVMAILSACTHNAKEEALVKQQAVVAVKDSLRLDSFKKAEVKVKEKEQERQAQIKEEKRDLLLSEQNEAASPTQQNTGEAVAPAKKKGWSQAAKGTLIGAGAGALGGVLVDKNNARGAIIGGVVGAGTGYVIGRGQDRKSGRVQPKK